jgi:hypothetical protein
MKQTREAAFRRAGAWRQRPRPAAQVRQDNRQRRDMLIELAMYGAAWLADRRR